MNPERKTTRSLPVLALAASAVALALPNAVADWPQFRGPTAEGHYDGAELPLEWDDVRNVAWKVAVPGSGWSSPVVVGDRVFLTTAVGSGGGGLSLRAICLSAGDGGTLWDREVFRAAGEDVAKIHRKNSHASPTPLVDGDRVYVHFGHLGTAALTTGGEVVWRNGDLRYPPVHGSGGCPVVAGDHLVFSCDGASEPFVVALDKDTGEVAWKIDRPPGARKTFSFNTPLLIEAGGRRQLVSCGSDVVQALDPAGGEVLWSVSYEGYSVVPRPVFAHGLVFVSTGFDNAVLMAIDPTGSGDVTGSHVRWTSDSRAPKTPSPLAVGGELFTVSDNGIVSCYDARSGELHWQERACGPASASPLHADGRIYIQDERGKGVVIRAAREFEILSENDLGEKSLASYAADDGALFIRTEERLYKIAQGAR